MDCSPSSIASTSSGSSMSSPVHPASLVDASKHSPALLQIVDLKITRPVIDYLVDCVSDTVDFAMGRPATSSTRGRTPSRRHEHTTHSKFTSFATNVLARAEVTMPVVLTALVYIDRAKPHLHIALEEWAMERVFLGSLILASKYLNDSTLKNVHWAICTGVFGKRDIGRIEREFLDVLDFELCVTEADLMNHHAGIAAAVFPTPTPTPTPTPSPTHRHTRVSRTAQHRRHHHHQRASVPALEPSSPSSSSSDGSSSSSPQTPSTVHEESSPESSISRPRPSVKPKCQSHAMFHDLIKAFPLPLPLPHRHHPTSTASHTRYPSVRVQT